MPLTKQMQTTIDNLHRTYYQTCEKLGELESESNSLQSANDYWLLYEKFIQILEEYKKIENEQIPQKHDEQRRRELLEKFGGRGNITINLLCVIDQLINFKYIAKDEHGMQVNYVRTCQELLQNLNSMHDLENWKGVRKFFSKNTQSKDKVTYWLDYWKKGIGELPKVQENSESRLEESKQEEMQSTSSSHYNPPSPANSAISNKRSVARQNELNTIPRHKKQRTNLANIDETNNAPRDNEGKVGNADYTANNVPSKNSKRKSTLEQPQDPPQLKKQKSSTSTNSKEPTNDSHAQQKNHHEDKMSDDPDTQMHNEPLQQGFATLKEQIASLEQQSRERITNLEQRNQSQINQIRIKNQRINSLELQIKTLETELSQAKEEAESSQMDLHTVQAQLNEIQQKLTEQNTKKEQEQKLLKKRTFSAIKAKMQAEDALKELNNSVETLKSLQKSEKQLRDTLNTKIRKLTKEKLALQASNVSKTADIERLEQRLDSQTESYQSKSGKIKKLEKEVSVLKKQASEQANQIRDREATIERLTKTQSLLEKRLGNLATENSNFKTQAVSQESTISNLRSQLNTNLRLYEELQTQLQTQLQEQRKDITTYKASLNQELTLLRRFKVMLTDDQTNKNQRIHELESELAKLSNEQTNKNQRIHELESELAKLSNEQTNKNQRIHELESELAKHRNEQTNKNQRIHELESALKSLQDRIEEISRNLQSTQDKLKYQYSRRPHREAKRQRNRLKQLRHNKNNANTDIDSLNQALEQVQREANLKENQLDSTVIELYKEKDKLKDANNKLKETEQQKDTLAKQVNMQDKVIAELSEKLIMYQALAQRYIEDNDTLTKNPFELQTKDAEFETQGSQLQKAPTFFRAAQNQSINSAYDTATDETLAGDTALTAN